MLQKTQTFNDGIVKIYSVGNVSVPGGIPKEELTLMRMLRYKERTVGFNRYYVAMQNNIEVAFVIRCQQLRDVKPNNVAILIDGDQYRIRQIQYPEDIDPPVMDLTLERVGELYDVS